MTTGAATTLGCRRADHMIPTGSLFAAAVAELIQTALVYVVTPDGEIIEHDKDTKGLKGRYYLTRAAAEAAALKIRNAS